MIDSGESFEGEIKQLADIDPLNPPEGRVGDSYYFSRDGCGGLQARSSRVAISGI